MKKFKITGGMAMALFWGSVFILLILLKVFVFQ